MLWEDLWGCTWLLGGVTRPDLRVLTSPWSPFPPPSGTQLSSTNRRDNAYYMAYQELIPIISVGMDSSWSDEEVLAELGRRLRRQRLNRNLTQFEVAEVAGVSVGSVAKVEAGSNTSLGTVVRLMRALGLVSRLDSMVPDPEVSPLQLAATKGVERHRARRRRTEPT